MTAPKHFSRWVELGLALLGAGILIGDKIVEWSCALSERVCDTFSFTSFMAAALLLAPYTLGRATAGAVWTKIPEMIVSVFGRKVKNRKSDSISSIPDMPGPFDNKDPE